MQKIYFTETLKIEKYSADDRINSIRKWIESELERTRPFLYSSFNGELNDEIAARLERKITTLWIGDGIAIQVGVISYSYPIEIIEGEVSHNNNIKVELTSYKLDFIRNNEKGGYICKDDVKTYEIPRQSLKVIVHTSDD